MSEFVTFEISKKLKEKGFPQSPDYFNHSSYYDWDGLRKIHSLSNASVWFDSNISRDNIYFAPTISQVLKWLREEKKKFVKIEMHECKYLFAIERTDECSFEVGFQKSDALCFLPYKTYEKAAIAGIEYVLDNSI